MRRREFVAGLASATLALPLVARAQRTIPFVGFLNSGSPNERAHLVDAFRRGLKEGGYTDGKDVAVEYRWAEGRSERLPRLASELVERRVSVIVGTGGIAPALAAKSATSSIPIVFTGAEDPVKLGLVASLSRPAGNATGITNMSGSLTAKRLQIMRELIPAATNIAYLTDPRGAAAKSMVAEIESAAKASGTRIQVVNATNEGEIDDALIAIKQARADALIVAAEPLFVTRRE